MTTKTWLKVFFLVTTISISTGCTVTLGDHSLTATPAANPGEREAAPHTQGASLAYDDHPDRGR